MSEGPQDTSVFTPLNSDSPALDRMEIEFLLQMIASLNWRTDQIEEHKAAVGIVQKLRSALGVPQQ